MHDLQPPRLPGRKQRVDVDLVCPTDEVALGLVVGRPVDGAAARVDSDRQIVATLERRLTLLDG